MKPFKLKNETLQREAWRQGLRRSYAATKAAILDKYESDLEDADVLRKKIARLNERIEAVEHKVANRADKVFGGWDVWRHDRRKMVIVFKDMQKATLQLREKRETLIRRIDSLCNPYVEEIARLDSLQHKLLNEA